MSVGSLDRRALRDRQRITLDVDGVPVDCEYVIDGGYYPGNDVEPPENPEAILLRATVGGVDVTAWADVLGVEGRLNECVFGNSGEGLT